MSSSDGVPVDLYIYDLSDGLAAVLSPALLGDEPLLIEGGEDNEDGRRVDGVWHTSVVVFEREYFFGGIGITTCAPCGTELGPPLRIERLGFTHLSFPVFVDYIESLATTSFAPGTYHLLRHNCNHFSEEVAMFLCGAHIPKPMLEQPRALPPALRLALTALLDNIAPDAGQPVYARGVRHSRRESPDFQSLNEQVERARATSAQLEARRETLAAKLARRQRRNDKKSKRTANAAAAANIHNGTQQTEFEESVRPEEEVAMAEALVEEAVGGPTELERRRSEEMKRRQDNPPIVYKDIDGEAEYCEFVKAVERSGLELSEEERRSLDELRQYLVLGEGSWVLGDDLLTFIGRILNEGGVACSAESVCEMRARCVRCLAAAALREDVSLLLHQDRRHHALLNYAHRIDTLSLQEQQALALFICNLFEHVSASEWLLYISEWQGNGTTLSNIRVTTKVCVHALLSGEVSLREVGAAVLHNIAAKEVKTVRLCAGGRLRALLPPSAKSKVFDEVCVELAMAALQALSVAECGEHVVFLCVQALCRLAAHSPDVPQLIAMVGPDPAAFRGMSARIDEQLDKLASAK